MRHFKKFTITLFIFCISMCLLSVDASAIEKKHMTKHRMLEYCDVYNSEDYDRVASEYYEEDLVFYTVRGTMEGRDTVRKRFIDLHKNLREIMTFKNIIIDGDKGAVEVDFEFTAREDIPDFLGQGPAKKGDVQRGSWGAFYTFRGDRITSIKLYNWR